MSMFTRNTYPSAQRWNLYVKWDMAFGESGSGLEDLGKKQKTTEELLVEAKSIIEKMKEADKYDKIGLVDKGRMQQLRTLMKQIDEQNKDDATKLLAEVKTAAAAPEVSTDDKERFEQLQTEWEGQMNQTKEKAAKEKADTIAATTKEVAASKENAGESRVVGMKEQAAALAKLLGVDEKDKEFAVINNLKDTNIQSLLAIVMAPENKSKMQAYVENFNTKYAAVPLGEASNISFDEHKALRDLGYTPNGSMWFGDEANKISKFFEFYLGKTDANFVQTTREYARAGLATTVTLSDKELLWKVTDKESLVTYLANVPNARYRKNDVEVVLNAIKNTEDFPKKVANIIGVEGISDIYSLIDAFKTHPEYKARFFDAVNTNGANRVVGLKTFLDGKGSEKAKEKAEAIQKAFDELAKKAEEQAQTALEQAKTPDEKQRIQTVLDEYAKKGGSSWLTGEIRKVAEGAFINVGRNANGVGAGMTFETFIKGLTVTLGAGVGVGKLGVGAVVRYELADGKITETNKKIIEGNAGIGTIVFPVFVPFIDGGVKAIDKVETFGMDGRGSIDSVGVHAQLMNVGGVAMLSFMNERQSEIEQGRAKMTEAVKQLAILKSSEVTPEKFKEVVVATGLKATDAEVGKWVQNIQALYARNPGADTISSDARAILLMGLVESEVEKAEIQEANNDKDARSFKGWSIGVGHILGVTFPVAGIAFKEGKMNYAYPDAALANAKAASTGSSAMSVGAEAGVQPGRVAEDVRGQTETSIAEYAGVIYVLNRSAQYKSFNKAISQIANQDYQAAYTTLDAFAKKDKRIADILKKLDAKNHPENLRVINTYTYGTEKVKNSTTGVDKATYNEARRATMVAEKREWTARWNTENEAKFSTIENHTPKQLSELIPGQELSTTVFATPRVRDASGKIIDSRSHHRLDKYEGSIQVSSHIFEVNEVQKDAIMNDHAAEIKRKVTELQDFVKASGKDGSVINEASYKEMLKTGTIPESWKSLELEFNTKPLFFETRAMAAGNICMNKVEGLAYPGFMYASSLGGVAKQEIGYVESLDVVGAAAQATQVDSGILAGGYGEKPKETVSSGGPGSSPNPNNPGNPNNPPNQQDQ